MGALDDFMAAGMGFLASADVAGENFTLRNTAFNGLISELGQTADWVAGGEKLRYRCTIVFTIPTVDFSAPALRNGELLTARGKTLKIEAIDKDATTYTLTCVDVTK